jgi:nucleotide-binding universal stress UspA family protein
VADKVLRASSIPVLLVRADVPEEVVNEKWPCRRFLVLLDGSELAEAVLPHVDAMAKQRGHELTDVVLLRVLEPLSTPTLSTPDMSDEWGQAVEEHISGSQQEIKEYLSEVAGRLKAAGVEVSTEMLEGIPSEEIVAYASDDPFNLIFMATHGRSGVSRWALGSVAEKILTGVSSPVFLVRPPQAHGESLIPPFVSAFKSLGPI